MYCLFDNSPRNWNKFTATCARIENGCSALVWTDQFSDLSSKAWCNSTAFLLAYSIWTNASLQRLPSKILKLHTYPVNFYKPNSTLLLGLKYITIYFQCWTLSNKYLHYFQIDLWGRFRSQNLQSSSPSFLPESTAAREAPDREDSAEEPSFERPVLKRRPDPAPDAACEGSGSSLELPVPKRARLSPGSSSPDVPWCSLPRPRSEGWTPEKQ